MYLNLLKIFKYDIGSNDYADDAAWAADKMPQKNGWMEGYYNYFGLLEAGTIK